MLIPKRAIKAFMDRPRSDYRTWKDMTEAELEERVRKLPVMPPIWGKLTRRQKVCMLIGALRRYFAFHNDTGEGKTLLATAIAAYFQALGEVDRVLVLVPRRGNKDEWRRQIEEHAPEFGCCVLPSSIGEKWSALEQDQQSLFFVDTFAGFMTMVTKLVQPKAGKRQKKPKLKPNLHSLLKVSKMVAGLIVDESTEAKNKHKLPFRLCRFISDRSAFTVTLTGTPFGRDPIDLWAQMFLADGGYTLGETLGLFRAAFFKEKQGAWATEYEFDKKKLGLLHRFLAHSSIRYEADPKTLPKLVPVVKHCLLKEDAGIYYDRALKAFREARGRPKEQRISFVRMRQISSGFVGFRDDERGIKAQFVFPHNPKLELLESTIKPAIAKGFKIIVFHDFILSGQLICKMLERLKVEHVWLYGGVTDKYLKQARNEFEHDPSCQVLVLENAFGAFGLNLQVAKVGIYYESPVSVIIRTQTRKRFERQRSMHKHVFMYDLVTRDTVDASILKFHKEGADLFRAIIDGRLRL